MTDDKIIQLFFQRKEAAIEETCKKYGSYCFKIANNILSNREDSEECLNDTWLRTWDSIPPTHPVHFNLFLAKVVRNIAINKYKSKRAHKRGDGEIALILDELEECIVGSQDDETLYIVEELQSTINKFIRGLPEKNGNVFIRRYFYADSIKDISDRYHISENNIRVMLNRTRNKLRIRLEKEGYI